MNRGIGFAGLTLCRDGRLGMSDLGSFIALWIPNADGED
jgi:hypothetical protein